MAAVLGYVAAFVWIWCSPGIVFPFPTWILLSPLTGKPVFICASFGCEREALGGGSLAAPSPVPLLCRAATGPSAPAEHTWVRVGWRAARGWLLLWARIFWLSFRLCYWVCNLPEEAEPDLPSPPALNGVMNCQVEEQEWGYEPSGCKRLLRCSGGW